MEMARACCCLPGTAVILNQSYQTPRVRADQSNGDTKACPSIS